MTNHSSNFIEKATLIHKGFYDYSLVDYVDANTLVKIICPIHGVFEQKPKVHLKGSGCQSCFAFRNSQGRTHNIDKFIAKAKGIHGDKYDYSYAVYESSKKKLEIKCNVCGTHFWQTPHCHTVTNSGCPNCALIKKSGNLEYFIEKARLVHGDKYDYSLVVYKTNKDKVKIICPAHGVFEQEAGAHMRGMGCIGCKKEKDDLRSKAMIAKAGEEFVEKANKKHNNRYDYSMTEYIGNRVHVKIICPIHGVFEQLPYNHLAGKGCYMCGESQGEKKISIWLKEHNIEYQREVRIPSFNSNKHFDFYLPKLNHYIEYDGEQHFIAVEFMGGEDGLKRRQLVDQKRNNYCKENNIPLLVITYLDDIESKLNSTFLPSK